MRQTSPTTVNVQGRELRLFGGTGYLGLSFEPEVIDALVLAARTFGLGIGTSPKTTGYSPELEQLESALAGFLRQQSVLVTGSGTLANVATIEGLSDDIDHWICDQDSHSSFSRLVSLSGKCPIYYRHLDYEHLRQVIDTVQGAAAVFTDAVFPLTGEVADIDEVAKASAAPGSLLIVDESHSVGVVGPHGRGLAEHLGITSDRLIVTSTLSKGLGSVGGAIGGPASLVDKIRRRATSYAGSAALPPALCSAASAAVRIVTEDGARLERLHDNCGMVAHNLPKEIAAWHGSEIPIPIFAIAASSHSDLVKLHEHCVDAGYFIPLIRGYPGAPDAGLLRMSVTSEHHPAEVAEVCGLIRSRIGLD